MLEWVSTIPAALTAVALVTLPGLSIAWLIRFRGFTLIAASIAASLAIIGFASLIAPALNIRWGILPILLTTAALFAALVPVRRFTKASKAPSVTTPKSALWAVLAVAIAAILIGFEVMRAIGSPENISQTYDGVFHINAAAQILLDGDASPLHMDLASPGASSSFYPTLWHAIVALVAQLSSVSIPVATNVLALVTAAWIWPVAILFFSRPFFVRRPVHLLLGAILAANFTAFPYLLLAWGVLYPNLLSTALIPIALGFIYPALRHRTVQSLAPLTSLWIAAVGATGAAALAHPNAIFGIAAFTIPMILVTANDIRLRPLSNLNKSLRWAALALVIMAYAALWVIVRTGDNERGYGNGVVRAFISGISNAPMVDTRAWFLTVLVFGGVVVLLVLRRHRWLVLSYAIALGLYVVAAGFEGPVRDMFTGAWYNDAHRLAALLPIGAIPLAAAASARLLDYVTVGLQNADPERISAKVRRYLPAIGAAIVLALILTGARGQNLALQSGWISQLHAPSENVLLSKDERTLLERLPSEVPVDALIAGDPWTGTGLALAISQRGVLFAHLNGSYDRETQELGTEFSELGLNACVILNDLGVTHLLDFGRQKYDVGNDDLYVPYAGLHNIEKSPVVTEIDREGNAALFRVNCN